MYKNKVNKYNVPIRFYPKYHISSIIVIVCLNLLNIILDVFLFWDLITKHTNIVEVLIILSMTLFSRLYALYLNIDLVNALILKRQYVEINYKGIIIKKLTKEIVLKWSEMYEVEHYLYRGTGAIRISREKDMIINKYLRTFGRWFGLFYIEIKNSKYKNVDINKFINTIEMYMKKNHLL